jgi:hypothetical protein
VILGVTSQVAHEGGPMALDTHALSELLDALRAGGDIDVIRAGMQLVAQALIELEATQQMGAGRDERSAERTATATAPVSASLRPRRATLRCSSRSCARARSTHRFQHHGVHRGADEAPGRPRGR